MTKMNFGSELKRWRSLKKVSQLDLALTASVSQRHVSWLETGKSQPSRDMVVQLAEALDMPLRARNELLISAGFAPLYTERGIEAEAMQPVGDALTQILNHHNPMPAFVLDKMWRIVMTNSAADRMLDLFGVEGIWDAIGSEEKNLALLAIHPKGMRPFIGNWKDLSSHFLQRLRKQYMTTHVPQERVALESIIRLIGDEAVTAPESHAPLLPVLPLVLRLDELELKLFTVISTFGTPLDVTVDELRIESFFAVDQATSDFFSDLQYKSSPS
ncbi:MAG: helix-turn-helix transcriptional regulator [Pseudomonadota bacterium]